jgi:deoxycytidine triphosphate deaminase
MYLADRQIRELLPQLAVEVEEGAEPFKPDEQVQPASVDLRLSQLFWRPQKRFTLDLRRARLLEMQPRRYYRRTQLSFGETITIRPRELLLGRTLEEFTVPNGYAAQLTGRSSFARLGLQVTASGGFINPGWRGRMPLQLANLSPNPIRLVPGLPICQVHFVRLTDLPEKPYGHPDLDSKYMQDDGGPSYWWRDKRIKALHERLSERLVEARIQHQVERLMGEREPEVIERFERFVAALRVHELQSADSLLERFAEAEDRRRAFRRWAINLSRGSFTVGISASLWVANKLPPVHWWHWVVWGAALVSIVLSLYAFRTEVGEHFGHSELRASSDRKRER